MKTIRLISLCLTVLYINPNRVEAGGPGNDKFLEAMQKSIKVIYEARDIAAFQEAINSFERIAGVETGRWEPLYYIAFGKVMMANLENDGAKKDQYLDHAMEILKKAKTIKPDESELFALEGFANMLRITVDPQSRGMVYAPQAMEKYNKAVELNPKNPRALALLAQMQFGTAQFFGSPVTEACETNAKALDSFSTYSSENPLSPTWGIKMAESLSQKCK